MILREARKPAAKLEQSLQPGKHRWVLPFHAFEWLWEWAALLLSNWRFLEVLEYLGSFSALTAVIFYSANPAVSNKGITRLGRDQPCAR
jgi:hypothetical protein